MSQKTNTPKSTTHPQSQNTHAGEVRNYTVWGVHTRSHEGDGTWYGRSNYRTEAEARAAYKTIIKGARGTRFDVAGISCEIQHDGRFRWHDARIVQIECESACLDCNSYLGI